MPGPSWVWRLLLLKRASLLAGGAAGSCPALLRLDGVQCFGLEGDAAGDESAKDCEARCCADLGCEVWQHNAEEGCFRGKPWLCGSGHMYDFARKATGARLREPIATPGSLTHTGNKVIFSDMVEVQPYAAEQDEHYFELEVGEAWGELFRITRHGPAAEQLEIWQYCWHKSRQPRECCYSEEFLKCWRHQAHWAQCCGLNGAGELSEWCWVDDINDATLLYLNQVIPPVIVDEDAFQAKRQRWRVGHEHPGSICPSRVSVNDSDRDDNGEWEELGTAATVSRLWQLLAIAPGAPPLSRTFVNLGAGTCQPPDPMSLLLQSDMGRGFSGLAVDANMSDLDQCSQAELGTASSVILVNLALDPVTAATSLRPHLAELFRRAEPAAQPTLAWHLDVLVVDIDGYDCLVAEELLQLVQPKVLVIEMAFHIPPPFLFSMQYEGRRAKDWLQSYDVSRLDPAAGCSLSYALHKFRRHGLALLRLTHTDAVFVHTSVVPVLSRELGIRFPQDEFECYRRSRLWTMLPGSFIQEWFFTASPAVSLPSIWSNLTSLGEELGRPGAPFSLDY